MELAVPASGGPSKAEEINTPTDRRRNGKAWLHVHKDSHQRPKGLQLARQSTSPPPIST